MIVPKRTVFQTYHGAVELIGIGKLASIVTKEILPATASWRVEIAVATDAGVERRFVLLEKFISVEGFVAHEFIRNIPNISRCQTSFEDAVHLSAARMIEETYRTPTHVVRILPDLFALIDVSRWVLYSYPFGGFMRGALVNRGDNPIAFQKNAVQVDAEIKTVIDRDRKNGF